MTTTVDEQLDEMVQDLGVTFDGVDDNVLTFAPIAGQSVDDVAAVLDKIMVRLTGSDILERLPEVQAIRIDA